MTKIGIVLVLLTVIPAVTFSLYEANQPTQTQLPYYQYFFKDANVWTVNQNQNVINWINSHKDTAQWCIGDSKPLSCGTYWLYDDPRLSNLNVNLPLCNSDQIIIWDFAYGKLFCVDKKYYGNETKIVGLFPNETNNIGQREGVKT